MGRVAFTGSDVIVIGSRIFSDLANGDVATLEFPNNLAEGAVSKYEGGIVAYNVAGKTADLTIRVIRGSGDDKFLNSEMNLYFSNRSSYPTLSGEFVKKIGSEDGPTTYDTYILGIGYVQKLPTVKDNVEGDVGASVTEYSLRFLRVERSIS